MTGTGTKTDPFVITTMEELMTMDEWSTRQSYAALGADFDFSDIANPQPIHLKCMELDGCGHTIRGIYVTKPNDDVYILVFSDAKGGSSFGLKNINIEAEAIAKRFGFVCPEDLSNVVYTTFTNCNIKITVHEGTTTGNRLFNSNGIVMTFNYCTVTINGTLYAEHELFGDCYLTGCQIMINIKIFGLYSTPFKSMKGIFESAKAVDTGFHGRYDKTPTIERIALFSGGGTFTNCYQAIEYPECNKVYWFGTIQSPCFYDAEKNSASMMTSAGIPVFALTTAQCKDAEYLSSIGFSCEGE